MAREEMDRLGWDQVDVLLVSGDAYVDHPSFGAALLGRWLGAQGYRVGVVAQPRWDSPEDVMRLGRPRLFAGVTAGALDSMLAHYTAFRKLRSDDAYTPGGRHGKRPNRASMVYTSLVRQAFPGLPVVLGGIEASLRRVAHYDFWSDKLRRSILLDSKADLLAYGMGERSIVEIARRVDRGESLRGIPGTAFALKASEKLDAVLPTGADVVELSDYDAILADAKRLMDVTLRIEQQVHDGTAWAAQRSGDRTVVLAPPAEPLDSDELDALYALPFARRAHPSYTEAIPAATMIQFSITSHRGCGGGCSFCSLALHQGRRIQSRSAVSIEAEARSMTAHPDWTGSITDVGGPTANMWGARCALPRGQCRRASCLAPKRCPYFKSNQGELAALLQRLTKVSGVKHVRVASGIRHDLAMDDSAYFQALLGDFVGGQLKLAPEHCCDRVLGLMRKPSFAAFEQFLTLFEQESRKAGKEQYVIPYLMSAFPGCTDADMRALADWLRQKGWKPRQVQCFIPTPGTVATAMYHASIDSGGNPIPVPRSDAERLRQHRILLGGKTG
jgi:uncharacterized radical SAM protein YgiQ